jgi:hypothetical protein
MQKEEARSQESEARSHPPFAAANKEHGIKNKKVRALTSKKNN